MGTEELERRLAELEHRLALIEKRLAEPEMVTGPSLLPPIIEPPFAAKAAAIAEDSLQSVLEVKPAALKEALHAKEQAIVAHLQPPPLPTQVVTTLNYQTHSNQAPPRRTNLEQAIGLRWAGWIGAIVLVIGGALAVKFAYDQGWWQGVPPQFRLVMMSLGGVILIGAGEWVYRRINVVAAASLFGAGIAIFFLVSYAGNAFYGLYSRDSAFVLMAVSTLIGAAVAMRGDMVSIAVLALIGGNVAPLVLTADHTHIPSFFGYLLMLQIVALFLAWHGTHGKWWTLRLSRWARTAYGWQPY